MKIYLLAALLLVAVAFAVAAPLEVEFEPLEEVVQVEERADRQRRVTCDLLSGLGVADSACAANCLSMGKSGGRCQDSVCVCRKTTIKDLWNKRFG